MELFGTAGKDGLKPLALRAAPRCLDEVEGQEELLGQHGPLRRELESDGFRAAVFYGPPGTGKTAVARVAAGRFGGVRYLNAAAAKPNQLRRLLEECVLVGSGDRRLLLFVDEIHRFNRRDQELLLPYLERGVPAFIGATAQNPYFSMSKALLSRVRLFQFKPLSDEAVERILQRALQNEGRDADQSAIAHLARRSGGDARKALSELEAALMEDGAVTRETLGRVLTGAQLRHDATDDDHYDTASAFIKSIRGSDPDAAVYYLHRLLEGGEDPRFALRRMFILASEDIGPAGPQALLVVAAAHRGYELVGRPEADLILTDAVIRLARAPKSNVVVRAMNAAKEAVREGVREIPDHLKDASFGGAKEQGRGVGYKYSHEEKGFQQFLPDGLAGRKLVPNDTPGEPQGEPGKTENGEE